MEFPLTPTLTGWTLDEVRRRLRGSRLEDLDVMKFVPDHIQEWLEENAPGYSVRMARARIKWSRDLSWDLYEKRTGLSRKKHRYYHLMSNSDQPITTTKIQAFIEIPDPSQALMFKLTF